MRSVFTIITPLPVYITQEAVIKLLHSHADMIKLNPLVSNFQQCDVPSTTEIPAEEHNFTWYEITDKVAYLPYNLLSGEVTFKACFCDQPMGLRTHVYAPMGLDMKESWSVESMSNISAENAKTDTETIVSDPGSTAAANLSGGLCLREDIDMQCNVFMSWFVKRTLKGAHAHLIDQLVLRFNEGNQQ